MATLTRSSVYEGASPQNNIIKNTFPTEINEKKHLLSNKKLKALPNHVSEIYIKCREDETVEKYECHVNT